MIINRKKIWELSWPIILANFSIPLVGLVDTLIMGHMPSSDYLAAVALGGITYFRSLINCTFSKIFIWI